MLLSSNRVCSAVQSEKKGSIGTVNDMVSRSRRQLAAAHLEAIDSRFRTQQIELRTVQMATSDLEKYHKACSDVLA